MVRPIGYGAVTMLSLALTLGAAEIASTQPVGPSGGPRSGQTVGRVTSTSILSAVQQFNERAAPPGRRFNYTSADNFVLGLVLAAATGKSVADYTREKLWVPLGAESKAVW